MKKKFTKEDLDKMEVDLINYVRIISVKEPDDLFTNLEEEEWDIKLTSKIQLKNEAFPGLVKDFCWLIM